MLVGYVRKAAFERNHEKQYQAILNKGVSENQLHIESSPRSDAQGPVLKKILVNLVSGDKLVVFRLASLARSVEGLNQLLEELQRRRIAVQSIQENIDTSQPDDEAFFRYSKAISSFTDDLKREKTLQGLASTSRRGGRPSALDDKQAKQAVKMLNEGLSISEIARKFKVPRTTIYRIKDRYLS